MAQPSVFVTRPLPPAVEAQLATSFSLTINRTDAPLAPDALREAMASHDAVLPTDGDRLCQAALDTPRPQAKILANYGPGSGHIDIEAVNAKGIALTNTPDMVHACTADLAMMLMLMVARRAGDGERDLRAGNWRGWSPTHMLGSKVSGKRLGIVGFGRVGRELARRASLGFGMEVLVHHPVPIPDAELEPFGARQVADLDRLLPDVDFVSLHCPGGGDNRHLIDFRRLALMRPNAFLINTACGDLVDDFALSQALMYETIGGAALDVFEREPALNPELAMCRNVVLLPHMGSATREAREAMGFRVMDNLIDFFEGREPRDRVN